MFTTLWGTVPASTAREKGERESGRLIVVGWICAGAFGGLVVGAVVKLADSIVKGFATSIAIILTSLCSYALFETPLNELFVLGTLVVTVCVFNYSEPDAPAPAPVALGAVVVGANGPAGAGAVGLDGAAAGDAASNKTLLSGDGSRAPLLSSAAGEAHTSPGFVHNQVHRIELGLLQSAAGTGAVGVGGAPNEHMLSVTDALHRVVSPHPNPHSGLPALSGKNE